MEKDRLMSLDAFRGFDMFWIMGGEALICTIAALFGKTEGWARVTYYRAKQMLCQAMKEEDDGKA